MYGLHECHYNGFNSKSQISIWNVKENIYMYIPTTFFLQQMLSCTITNISLSKIEKAFLSRIKDIFMRIQKPIFFLALQAFFSY